MQYVRRRIQRVSGITVRDERIESRDFSMQPSQDRRDESRRDRRERAAPTTLPIPRMSPDRSERT